MKQPLSITEFPWVYPVSNKITLSTCSNMGKWMLFYHKDVLNNKWYEINDLYENNKLNGVLHI